MRSAAGRAVGLLDTPPVMFADGSLGPGGPYDGIITLNPAHPLQFTRPVAAGNYDAQMFTEHEIDEVLGLGSHLNSPRPEFLEPQDLFSWASLNARNTSASGQRFFSIDQGFHLLAQFNQNPDGDFGDWDSDDFCPATRLYVQTPLTATARARIFPQPLRKPSAWMLSVTISSWRAGRRAGSISIATANRISCC